MLLGVLGWAWGGWGDGRFEVMERERWIALQSESACIAYGDLVGLSLLVVVTIVAAEGTTTC